MENIYYVYAHINPITKKVFYIGIGCKHRVIEGGRLRNRKWQEEVYNAGGFLFEFFHTNITKAEALKLERHYILKYGIENLTNIVAEQGNSTAFKKGQIPWNKGLKNAQSCSYKNVIYKGKKFESVDLLILHLGIAKTTFYRRIKKGQLIIKYVSKDDFHK